MKQSGAHQRPVESAPPPPREGMHQSAAHHWPVETAPPPLHWPVGDVRPYLEQPRPYQVYHSQAQKYDEARVSRPANAAAANARPTVSGWPVDEPEQNANP